MIVQNNKTGQAGSPAGDRISPAGDRISPAVDRISPGKRILTAVSAPVLAVLLVIYEKGGGTGALCGFHQLTGLYCPGCGSGRAVKALFEGQFSRIWSYNPLLPVLGIPCLIVLAHEYLRIVFPALKLKPVRIPAVVMDAAVAVILLFWILRNIPAFAFLAPHG